MRIGSLSACLLVAAAWGTEAIAAPPVVSEAAYEAAIARLDLNAAGEIFDSLVKQRLPKAPGRPDPLLDRLLVEQMVTGGQVSAARPVIERVIRDAGTKNADHFRLLLASVSESEADLDEAARLYGQVAASRTASPADRLAATLGTARVQMATDPAAAARTLAAIDRATVPKGSLWEVDLLVARASTMAQAAASEGRAALDRAWTESADAPLTDAAVLRVASDRAIAAGRAGDRAALVAMLAVDRGNRNPNDYQNVLANNLPVCGTNGIAPGDAVAIAVTRQPVVARPRVELVWASRPGIARAFLAATPSGAPVVMDGRVAPFVLRCRTAPTADYTVPNRFDQAIIGWMTGLGAYPLVSSDDDNDAISLAGALAERQARYGATSIMAMPVLLRIANGTAMNMSGDDDARRRSLDTMRRAQAIFEGSGAPADVLLVSRLAVIGLQVVTNEKTEQQAVAETQAIVTQAAKGSILSPGMLYWVANGMAQAPKVPSGFKAATLMSVHDVLARTAGAGDPRTKALALRLYRLRVDTGDQAGAKAAIAGLGLAPDLCVLADPPTRFVSSAIASDDYPGDLIFANVRGFTRVEFTIDAAGAARDGRLLVTDPAYAFDAIATERIPTIRYDPARIGGKVAACRGETQGITWQLPS